MKALTETRLKAGLAAVGSGLAVAISALAADLHVPAGYPTIQAAVDAASNGDTIHIASGVYSGQVLISNKSLTLSGSPGTVLRAVPGMSEPYAGLPHVPLLSIARADVVLSGLALEGERLADSQVGIFHGIYFLGSGGRVENCRITGFRRTLGLGAEASGIRVVNPIAWGTAVRNIQVLNSVFADNLTSIELGGDSSSPTLLRTTFAVNDNTITGNGPDATAVQRGIWIEAGAGGKVTHNTITDHDYIGTDDPTPFAQGILADDASDFDGVTPLVAVQPVRYEGNIFRNNQQHLVVFRGDDSRIVNNSFEGAGPGYRPGGLYFSGENVVVGTNRFSDMDTGIVLFGNDPEFGTYLGITSNAGLIANDFCNVVTNVVQEELTTYNEEGTTECLPPVLDIRAVQLSWPYSYNGYSVQTAPAVNGSWSTSDATPFLQNGQNNVVMPADSDQQYFKLVKQQP